MPLLIAIAIAVLGVLGLLFVDHGSCCKPKVQTTAMAHYSTPGEAARAIAMPSEPKSQLEPDAPGPRPVHPANPEMH